MKYYPPLSQLISREAIPADVGIIPGATETAEQALNQLLSGIGFKDLIINLSTFGDVRFYSLTIVGKEIGFKLPGTDVSFLFFPGEAGSGEANIPIAFEWRWGVRRYVHDFEAAVFSRSPRAFFDILLKIANISEAEFIDGVITVFIGDPDPYVKLVQDVRAIISEYSNGTATLEDPSGEILAKASAILFKLDAVIADLQDPTQIAVPFDSEVDYIADRFEDIAHTLDIDLDVCQLAFQTVTRNVTDIDEKLEQLLILFGSWFSGFDWHDVEEVLVPQFSLAVTQLPVALEFPRKWLVPLDTDGEPIANEAVKSRLKFNAGAIRYSTKTGLTFEGESSFDFTKSMIGNTGLTLEFDDAKVDFSRTTNIAEADAAGYPVDFVGVYVKYLEIGLPKKWFKKHQSSPNVPVTLGIVGRELLLGTGGISGEIGLEVLAAGKPKATKDKNTADAELEFVLGKQPPAGSSDPPKGFKIGFSKFDMKFRQNVLLESTIKGSLTIPKFDSTKPIGIELFIAKDGDFKVTASVAGGHLFEAGSIFAFNAMSMSIEKDDNRVYAEATGDLSFPKNSLLKNFIKEPIHIEKLRIGSDGSFEIDGGTIPLPESVVIPLGPAKIAITAIHCGSHEQEHGGVTRKYRYWGFDGGINVNPGGIDARGDGIKYYYTVDNGSDADHQHHHFLRIEGIGIDLVIPGTASKDQAVLLLKGYLALKNPVYKGSLSFSLPKVKIAGGASMVYNTEVPAWLVDVWLELPKPIPLGATSLGIYGFRGLFGLRYVASKQAEDIKPPLEVDASWGDYYRAAPKGVSYQKFISPPATKAAGNPFSVGAGVSLATAQDGGKAFTSQLFLLVSIPNLILLEGRADILAKKRVGLTDEDPPYYAYLALSPESIEIGAGVSYKLPKETGETLDLTAVFEAAFFFRNRNAWYIHFGTKKKPITARIISLFDGYCYLMLSASGIEAGAGVHFDFNKRYGPVAVSAHAYLDMWAYISFQGAQSGGGIALGGYVDVRVMGVGFHIELAAGLTVEVPRPFRVAGYVEVCVSVDLKIKKFEKCVNLEFVWEKSKSLDTSPVWALTDSPIAPPAIGVHMASGATYEVEFSTNPNSAAPPIIPLDTYIDVKFSKPVNPSKVPVVSARIGGFTNPPSDNTERLPPQYGSRIVTHSYALEDVKLEVWQPTMPNWIDYDPFVALAPGALVGSTAGANLAGQPIGSWQKQEPGYAQIRFLALTPFNYMEPIGGYRPEEMGLTAQTIFCQGRERTERCLLWDEPAHYSAGSNYYGAGILYRIEGSDGAALALTVPPLDPVSLGIKPGARAVFLFTKRTVFCRLTLSTNAPEITLRFQRRKPASFSEGLVPGEIIVPYAAAEFEDVAAPTVVPRSALAAPVIYDNPAVGIDRVILETPAPNAQAIADLEEKIALRGEDLLRAWYPKIRLLISQEIARLKEELEAEHNRTCVVHELSDPERLHLEIRTLSAERASLQVEIQTKTLLYNTSCRPVPPFPPRPPGGRPPRPPFVPTTITPILPPASARPPLFAEEPLSPPTIPPTISVVAPLAPVMSPEACRQLAEEIAALQKRLEEIEARIRRIREILATTRWRAPDFPVGWECGTFVHEICWLSEEDSQYNQTIPTIAAIEADFDSMRTAVESTIAPIWRPNQQYRITLTVSDTVTPSSNPLVAQKRPFYVHFQTKGPIGHYDVPPERPGLDEATQVPDDGGPEVLEDGRPEVPERFLKFYIDMERSYPDPSGNLLYAKPLYYHDVALQLFLTKPYAYHFFADWPAYPPVSSGLGVAPYAIEIRIKDPAEAQPSSVTPDHTEAIVPSALTGTQTWEVDPSPRQTEDLKILNNFHEPELLGGASHATACLTTGGAPIVPAAKVLITEIKNLEPNKLYTAVVLNKDLSVAREAEVHRYPFKTSQYGDFETHIGSYKLKDIAGNERLAVFKVSHNLANGAGAPLIYDAALKIIKREPTTEAKAYPDFFDRLIHACLKLEPLPPAATLEFNFVENALTAEVYGLLLRSREALNDPRIPLTDLLAAVGMNVSGAARTDARVLLSKDCCQAFVMVEGGVFPTTDISFQFSLLTWDKQAKKYVAKETIVTESFSSP